MAINNVQNLGVSENFNRILSDMSGEHSIENPKNIRGDTDFKEITLQANDEMRKVNIHDAIDRLNNLITMFNKRLKLSVHNETKQVVIKIIDQKTDKVVREIPPKEFLSFVERFHKLLGVFIDKKS